jgi:hypothetical protein
LFCEPEDFVLWDGFQVVAVFCRVFEQLRTIVLQSTFAGQELPENSARSDNWPKEAVLTWSAELGRPAKNNLLPQKQKSSPAWA